jgi:TPP-dependent pyruvate/acetoin dehydrogenase alpha subunit
MPLCNCAIGLYVIYVMYFNTLDIRNVFLYYQCPIVFCITDNGMSISLRDNGWIHQLYNRFNMPKFVASAHDFTDIYDKSKQAIDHARQLGRPALLVVTGLSRRFGHAATDRQIAYMSTDEIRMKESTNDFYGRCFI